MVRRRSVRPIGFSARSGSLPSTIPSACAGMPKRSRRTMFGGVRTDSRTRAAPPSTRSTAISAPEFPVPTTSTSRPRNAPDFGTRPSGRARGGTPPGRPLDRARHVAVAGRDDGAPGLDVALRRRRDASRRPSVDPLHADAEPRPDAEAICIRVEVGDEVLARDPAAVERESEARQAGERAHRMQVKTVVAPRPPGRPTPLPVRARAARRRARAAPRPPRARRGRLRSRPSRERSSSSPRAELGDPGRSPKPEPDRGQQHVEDDDGGTEHRPPERPVTERHPALVGQRPPPGTRAHGQPPSAAAGRRGARSASPSPRPRARRRRDRATQAPVQLGRLLQLVVDARRARRSVASSRPSSARGRYGSPTAGSGRSSARRSSPARSRTAPAAARCPSRLARSRSCSRGSRGTSRAESSTCARPHEHEIRLLEPAADAVVVLDRELDRLDPPEVGMVERSPRSGRHPSRHPGHARDRVDRMAEQITVVHARRRQSWRIAALSSGWTSVRPSPRAGPSPPRRRCGDRPRSRRAGGGSPRTAGRGTALRAP